MGLLRRVQPAGREHSFDGVDADSSHSIGPEEQTRSSHSAPTGGLPSTLSVSNPLELTRRKVWKLPLEMIENDYKLYQFSYNF